MKGEIISHFFYNVIKAFISMLNMVLKTVLNTSKINQISPVSQIKNSPNINGFLVRRFTLVFISVVIISASSYSSASHVFASNLFFESSVGTTETVSISNSNVNVVGGAGTDILKISSYDVVNINVDANVEEVEFPGNYNVEYTAIYVSGTGVQFRKLNGTAAVTLGSINNPVTIKFNNGSTIVSHTLTQTSASTFYVDGNLVPSALNTTNSSGSYYITAANSPLVVNNNNVSAIGSNGDDVIRINSGITGVGADGNINSIVFNGNYSTDYTAITIIGTGFQMKNSSGVPVVTAASLNQPMNLYFYNGSTVVKHVLTQTSGNTYFIDGVAVPTSSSGNGGSGSSGSQVNNANGSNRLSSGGGNSCVLKDDGSVWCWGAGPYQSSGNFLMLEINNVPKQSTLFPAGTVKKLYSDGATSCALKSDDSLVCWGAGNFSGTLGNGTQGNGTGSSVPVQVIGMTAGTVKDVSMGNSTVCALKIDGSVWCWGTDNGGTGKLGDGIFNHDTGTPTQVLGLGVGSTKEISVGAFHACAVKTDGSVWCWGSNWAGELGSITSGINNSIPVQATGLSSVDKISLGQDHSCALKTDGSVWCWGLNGSGQLGNGNTTNSSVPVPVTNLGLNTTKEISLGAHNSCAIKTDGSTWCWGINEHGSLGNGSNVTNSSVPVQVSGLTAGTTREIASGTFHTCVIKTNGSVWCWGWHNSNGVGLGDGVTSSSNVPIQITSLGLILGGGSSTSNINFNYTSFNGVSVTNTLGGYSFRDDGSTSTIPSSVTTQGGGFYNKVDSVVRNDYTLTNSPYIDFAFDPSTNSIWTTSLGDDRVIKTNVITGTSTSYGGVSHPYSLTFDSLDNTILVAGYADIYKIRPSDGQILRTYTNVGTQGGRRIAFDVRNNTAWIVNMGNGFSKVNLSTGVSTDYFTGINGPAFFSVIFDSGTNSVWASSNLGFVKINPETGTTTVYGLNAGGYGYNLTTNPRDGSIWTVSIIDPVITKLNPYTGATTTYNTGYIGSYGMVYYQPTDSVIFTSTNSHKVIKINAKTGDVVQTYDSPEPVGIAVDPFTDSIWTTNVNTGNVTKLKLENTDVSDYGTAASVSLAPSSVDLIGPSKVTSFKVSAASYWAAFDPYTQSLWTITDNNPGDTGFLTRTTFSGATTTYNLGTNQLRGIAFYPPDNSILVSDSNSIKKIRTSDGQVLSSYPVSDGRKISINTNDGSIWATSYHSVSRIDGTTGNVTATYEDPSGDLFGAKYDSYNDAIWYYAPVKGYITKLDPYTGATTTYNIAGASDIAFDSKGFVWVLDYSGSSKITRLNPRTGVIKTYDVGGRSTSIAFDSYTNSIWTTGFGGGNFNLTRLDVASGKVFERPTMPGASYDVVFDPDTHTIWTTNPTGDGTVSRVDISKHTPITATTTTTYATSTYAVGNNARSTTFDPSTNSVWVTNWADNTISKLDVLTGAVSTSTVSMPSGVKKIVKGSQHTCALKIDGSAWCWGKNSERQLGNGNAISTSTPVQVIGLTIGTVKDIISMLDNSCALKTDGSVVCWGGNSSGELGDGTNNWTYIPVQVSGLTAGTVKAVFTGGYRFCALKVDNSLVCWGDNTSGSLGDGTTTNSNIPVQVVGLTTGTVKSVESIGNGFCALKIDGSVVCWGSNWSGQLGNGANSGYSSVPDQVVGLTTGTVKSLSIGGGSHICAVKTDDSAVCWGYNINGQLGNGATTNSNIPVQVTGLTSGSVKEIYVSGFLYTCALKMDSSVSCWGANDYGQLGNNDTSNSSVPVQVVGLTAGTVKKISSESYSSCALKIDGSVVCWGQNNFGQLGNGTTTNSNIPVQVTGLTLNTIKDITDGPNNASHYCVIKTDSSVVCWGANHLGQLGNSTTTNSNIPVQVTGLTAGYGHAQISTGSDYSCALESNGSVWCWGQNGNGQLGNGNTTDSVTPVMVSGLSVGTTKEISVGDYHSCALKIDGSVVCWGSNGGGQLGNGTTTESHVPVQVTGLTAGTVLKVEVGNNSSCALKTDGSTWCWGSDQYGQLGDGSNSNSSVPVQVYGLSASTTQDISLGGAQHACALKVDGSVVCWGYNTQGQLGDNTTTNSNVPVQVTGLTSGTVQKISVGTYNACAIKTDGSVVCWGENLYSGEIGDGTNINRLVPTQVSGLTAGTVSDISLGFYHTCAVKTDGSTWCWGYNAHGELGDGTTDWTNTPVQVSSLTAGTVSDISLGEWHSCALKTDGSIACWGWNDKGALGNGTTTNTNIPVQVNGLSSGASQVISSIYSTGGTYPTDSVFDPSTNSIWVINMGSNNVTKIDTQTGSVLGTHNTGSQPVNITFDPLTNSVWVSNYSSSTISKFRASDMALLATVNVGNSPAGITFDSFTNSIWVINQGDGNISKINPTTGDVIGTYAVGNYASNPYFDPNTHSIWTADMGTNNITRLDVTDGHLVATYVVDFPVYGVAFSPIDDNIWAVDGASNSVVKLNPSTGTVIETVGLGAIPVDVAFDTYTDSVWMPTNGNMVTKMSIVSTSTLVSNISSHSIPHGESAPFLYDGNVVFDPSTNSIWAITGNSSVVKVNATTGSTTGEYFIGGGNLSSLMYDPSTYSIWVSGYSSSTVTKLRASDGVVLGSYSVPYAGKMVFDSYSNSVWIASNSGGLYRLKASDGSLLNTCNTGACQNMVYGLAFDPITNSIWATTGNGTFKLNISTGTTTSYGSPMNQLARSITFDPYSHFVWETYDGSASIGKRDIYTGNVVDMYGMYNLQGELSHPNDPWGSYFLQTYSAVVFDPFNDYVWLNATVTGPEYGNIKILNSKTGELVGEYSAGLYYGGLAFDSINNSIWIANYASSSLYKIHIADVTHPSVGTFTSAPINKGNGLSGDEFSWVENLNGQTITMKVRSSATSDFSSSTPWSSCSNITNGALLSTSNCVTAGDSYVQYQASLSTNDLLISPLLSSVRIGYSTESVVVASSSPVIDTTYGNGGILVSVSDINSPDPGVVNISYVITNANPTGNPDDPITTTLEYNTGGGWIPVDPSEFTLQTVGSTTEIIWSATSTVPSVFLPSVQVRVTLTNTAPTDNVTVITSSPFSLDTFAPVVEANMVPSFDFSTSVITLTTTDGSLSRYRICNDSAFPTTDAQGNSCAWSVMGGNLASTTINLNTQLGISVYVQVQDEFGNIANKTLSILSTAPQIDHNYGTNGTIVTQNNATSTNPNTVTTSFVVTNPNPYSSSTDPVTISLEYTLDGVTWIPVATSSFEVQTVGSTTEVIWSATTSLPNTFSTTTQTRVTITNTSPTDNTTVITSQPFTLDTLAPTVNASFDSNTNSVILTTSDNSQSQYRICNDPLFPSTDAQGNSCAWSVMGGDLTNATTSWVPQFNVDINIQVRDIFGNITNHVIAGLGSAPQIDVNYGTNGINVALPTNASSSVATGTVDVSFVVTNPNPYSSSTDPVTISLEYTLDGTTWIPVATSSFEVQTVGSTTEVIWSATTSLPNTFSTTTQTRVTITNTSPTDNTTVITSQPFTLDTLAPTVNASFDSNTNSVILTTSDNSQSQYRICNDPLFLSTDAQGNSCAWSAMGGSVASSSVPWTINVGTDIHVEVMDSFGNLTVYTISAPNMAPEFDPSYGTNGISVYQVATSSDSNYGKVFISYSIRDIDTISGTVTPSFQYNTGSGWTAISPSDLAVGDTNDKAVDAVNFNTYTATWSVSSTLSNTFSTSTQVRVILNDNAGNNNTTPSTSSFFTLDTKSPVITTIFDPANVSSTVTLSVSDGSDVQYRVCNDQGFPATDTQGNNCEWSSLLPTTNPIAIPVIVVKDGNGIATAYIEVRDATGNIITKTLISPATPTDFILSDISNPAINSYKEFISWSPYQATTTGATFASYEVYNSTDGNNYTLIATITSPDINYFRHIIDSNNASSTEYYKVRVTTVEGGVSESTAAVSDVPNGIGGPNGNTSTSTPDILPPVVLNISIPSENIQTNQAIITFTTDEIATAVIEYQKAGELTWTTINVPSFTADHSVVIPSLEANTTYHTRITTTDVTGNTSAPVAGPDFTTVSGPIISNVTTTSVGESGATVQWNTTESSDSFVFYSTSPSFTNPVSVGSQSFVTCSTPNVCAHSVVVSPENITPGTTIYYYVQSTDAGGNVITDNNNFTYYSFTTSTDTTPPTIVGDISTPVISSDAAVITWETSEPATTQVLWGTESGNLNRTTVVDPVLSTYHIVTLSGDTLDTNSLPQTLTPNTAYYYKVVFADAAGNATSSSVQSFSTNAEGQVITTVQVVSTGGGSSITTEPVASVSINSGDTTTGASDTTTDTSTTPSTPDTTSPVLASGTTENTDVGAFSVDIKVVTNEDTQAFVSYGDTTAYGSTEADASWAKTRTITLNKLQPGTTYHYVITVRDRSGNDSISGDKTILTLYASEPSSNSQFLNEASVIQSNLEQLIESAMPSLATPFVSSPIVDNITETEATVTWETNVNTIGSLAYTTDQAFKDAGIYSQEASAGTEKTTLHTVRLTNLLPNTVYHIKPSSYVFPQVVGTTDDITFSTKTSKVIAEIVDTKKDSFTVAWKTDNLTSSIVKYKDMSTGESRSITDNIARTDHSIKVSGLTPDTEYLVKVSGVNENGITQDDIDSLTTRTSSDVIAPIISNFKVDNALVPGRTDRIQTVIGWQTDEAANAVVYYEEGLGDPNATGTIELANKVEATGDYSMNHVMILANLNPGTVYRVTVVSTDPSGNYVTFGPNTMITPKETDSILEIIFKNFEDTFRFLRSPGQ